MPKYQELSEQQLINLSQQIKHQEEQLRSVIKDAHDISDAENTLNSPYKHPLEKIYAIFNASNILGKYIRPERNKFWRRF